MPKGIHPRTHKYPFYDLEVGQNTLFDGDYRLVRIAADNLRKRTGKMFLVSKTGGGVKILRYK